MRSNLFALRLLVGLLLPAALMLGLVLSKGGFTTAANIVYILDVLAYVWVLRLSRCPHCSWPLLMDFRRRPGDCPRCGSTEDIKL